MKNFEEEYIVLCFLIWVQDLRVIRGYIEEISYTQLRDKNTSFSRLACFTYFCKKITSFLAFQQDLSKSFWFVAKRAYNLDTKKVPSFLVFPHKSEKTSTKKENTWETFYLHFTLIYGIWKYYYLNRHRDFKNTNDYCEFLRR